MNIGITFIQKEPGDSIWTNGIKLNALILAKMFMHSKNKHKVYLVNRYDVKGDETTPWDLKKYPLINQEEAIDKVDLMISLGAAITDEYIKRFKAKDSARKVITYHCGNHYILEMEKVLFGENKEENKPLWNQEVDEYWLIPQQELHNLHYTYTFTKTPVRIVPFIWDPEHIQNIADSMKASKKFNKVTYQPGREKKRISIFEPNINSIKYGMIPVHIAEWANWDSAIKDKIEFMSLTNGLKLAKNHEFNGHIKYLDIFKEKKFFAESRFNMPYFLAEHTDIVVSHQWGNPLNYAYLDALYFGYPLIHNADMVQDMGYYYKDFNIEEGANQLKHAILEHDKNHQEYNKRNTKLLKRYLATNKQLIEQYDQLLDNLMNGRSDFKTRSGYDWKTNSVEV